MAGIFRWNLPSNGGRDDDWGPEDDAVEEVTEAVRVDMKFKDIVAAENERDRKVSKKKRGLW